MHLCVIGNSHISALKLGWDAPPNVTATFFGSTSQMLRNVEQRYGVVEPTIPKLRRLFLKTAGLARIRVADYDAFVLVGLGVGPVGVAKHGGAVFRRLAVQPLVNAIRTADARTSILLVPEPYPCPGFMSVDRQWADNKRRAEIVLEFDDALQQLTDRLRIDVSLQPLSTLAGGFTIASYGVDAPIVGTDTVFRDSDHRHMNAAYGAAVWRELTASMRRSSSSSLAISAMS